MKMVQKTLERVVIEVTSKEIEEDGFDIIWDKIRKVYTAEEYDVYSIGFDKKSEDILFVELSSKKIRE